MTCYLWSLCMKVPSPEVLTRGGGSSSGGSRDRGPFPLSTVQEEEGHKAEDAPETPSDGIID